MPFGLSLCGSWKKETREQRSGDAEPGRDGKSDAEAGANQWPSGDRPKGGPRFESALPKICQW